MIEYLEAGKLENKFYLYDQIKSPDNLLYLVGNISCSLLNFNYKKNIDKILVQRVFFLK